MTDVEVLAHCDEDETKKGRQARTETRVRHHFAKPWARIKISLTKHDACRKALL